MLKRQILAKQFDQQGVSAIVYTDIARDGMMQGVNVEATVRLGSGLFYTCYRVGRYYQYGRYYRSEGASKIRVFRARLLVELSTKEPWMSRRLSIIVTPVWRCNSELR